MWNLDYNHSLAHPDTVLVWSKPHKWGFYKIMIRYLSHLQIALFNSYGNCIVIYKFNSFSWNINMQPKIG